MEPTGETGSPEASASQKELFSQDNKQGQIFQGFQCVLVKSLREAEFRAPSIFIVLVLGVELLTYCSA